VKLKKHLVFPPKGGKLAILPESKHFKQENFSVLRVSDGPNAWHTALTDRHGCEAMTLENCDA